MSRIATAVVCFMAFLVLGSFLPAEAPDPVNTLELVSEFPGLNCRMTFFTSENPSPVGLKRFKDGVFEYYWVTDELEIRRSEVMANGVSKLEIGRIPFVFTSPQVLKVIRNFASFEGKDFEGITNWFKTILLFCSKTASFRNFELVLEREVRDSFRSRNYKIRTFNRLFHQFFFFIISPELYNEFAPRIARLESSDKELMLEFNDYLSTHSAELAEFGKTLKLERSGVQSPDQAEWMKGFIELLFLERQPPFSDRNPRSSERPNRP
ncbi:MAG: hypothetical protein Kow00107_11170 [Planctomycetota bacterium]